MNTIFKVTTIIINIIWITVEIRHFHYSNLEVLESIKSGKTSFAIDNIQSLMGEMGAYNKCMDSGAINNNQTVFQSSNTKEFIYLFGGMSEDGIQQLKNLDRIQQCLKNPYALIEVVERAAWSGLNMQRKEEEDDDDDADKDKDEDKDTDESYHDEDEETSPEINTKPYHDSTAIISSASFAPKLYKIIPTINGHIFDIQNFAQGTRLITFEFQQKNSYMKGMHYLENLADPDNDDLARKLLNDQDFKIYKKEMSSNKPTTNNQIITVEIQKPPSYFGKVKVIAGTVYEIFFNKPSHSHIMDIINRFRDTIISYTRTMRQQYHMYNDLFQDIIREFERITTKSAVAWNRAKWIFVNAGVLGAQIGELIAHDISPYLLKYIRRELAIESINSIAIARILIAA